MPSSKSAPESQALTDKQLRFRRLLSQGAREGAAIALIAICVYLSMALLTFNPADPGWASIGHDTSVTNYAGRSGAWLASLMMDFFGQVSLLFPLLIAVYVVRLVRARHQPLEFHGPMLALRLGGFLLVLMSASSLLSLYSVFGLDANAGGVLGSEVSSAMVAFFNLPATTVLLVAIFLFAITIFTGLSWFALMDWVGRMTLKVGRTLRAAFDTSVDKTKNQPKEPAKAAKPAVEKSKPNREPPVVNERVRSPSDDTDNTRRSLFSRLKALFRRNKTAAKSQPAGMQGERQEPRFEDYLAAEESRLLENFAADEVERGAGKPQKEASPAKQSSGNGLKKALKISPFKREEELRQGADEPPQRSLFDDIDSVIPPLTLLDPPDPHQEQGYTEESLEHMSRLLEEKLADFGVSVEVVEVNPGPVITRFEIKPAAGVKVSRISNLAKDLARSLAVLSVRVVEVIPGKSVVGIEIPNEKRQIVRLSEVLDSKLFRESTSPLTLALGNDIGGNPMTANLAKMPHLLVAGTTGSGKSVGVNAMLLSMLLKATPDEVRFIMVDPKMLELSIYEGIPHLLAPVVTDMKEAANALRWSVAEMERRYKLMASLGVRNIAGYNRKVKDAIDAGEPLLDPLWKPDEYLMNGEEDRPELETLPFIVVVIDEFADMMMIVGKKVEELIARIAQKARAAGIHLILATQRPSVDVITGLIKANIPTRMSFQVSSKIDSRTVLDQGGAEQLLGHGDMLYLPPGSGLPVRVHGAFVDDDEVHRVVSAWKARGEPIYVDDVLNGAEGEYLPGVPTLSEGGDSEGDSLYDEAVAFVTESRRVSISSVQRKFKIGYNRAANLVDAMEASGVVSPAGHNGSREVLAPPPPRD